jgi:fibronectin-binding autotransporter adhesin
LILGSLTRELGTTTFNLSGGTIQASKGFSTIVPMSLGPSGGGATFDTAGYAVTLAGSLSGPGSLTKIGSSTLVLAASNSYTGLTNFNGGILSLANSAALAGGGYIAFGGGTLQYTGSNQSDYSARIVGSTGPISVDTNGVNLTFASGLDGSNSGGLTKAGSGMLILAASNGFAGNTRISGGTLALANSVALQKSTLDTSGTGSLNFGSLTTATLGSLTGSGSLTLSNSASLPVALTVGSNNASTTYSGKLSAAGGLTKVGSGTLTLAALNSFGGTTVIDQGRLVIDGSLASPVLVNRGGVLAGTGSLSNVQINAGGTLAPGDALGALKISGSLVLASSAELAYALDTPSTSDLVSCGSLTLNGQQFSDFNFTWTSNFGPGTYNLIAFGTLGGAGPGSNRSGTIDGYPASLVIRGNDLVLNVVPEPSALALLSASAVGLLSYTWRRRKRTV